MTCTQYDAGVRAESQSLFLPKGSKGKGRTSLLCNTVWVSCSKGQQMQYMAYKK